MTLKALVEEITGVEFEFAAKKGQQYAGPCPFCGGDDRFQVWLDGAREPKEHYWCRKCGKKGGTVSLLMQIRGISMTDAVQELEDRGYKIELDEAPPKPKKAPLPPSKSDFSNHLAVYEDVQKWHLNGRQKAIDYFSKWELTPEDIDRAELGYGHYEGREGYTIPHYWVENGQYYLRGVKFRHITDDKRRRFSTTDGALTSGIYGMEWVSTPDGTSEGPLLDYLIIVEAEKDKILLDGMGFPTISYHPEASWDYYLQHSLHNVIQPIVLHDVDEAGVIRAQNISRLLRTRPLISSTKGFNQKSPSDVAAAFDKEVLSVWIQEEFQIESITT